MEAGRALADEMQVAFLGECSSKTSENVSEIMMAMINLIYQRMLAAGNEEISPPAPTVVRDNRMCKLL